MVVVATTVRRERRTGEKGRRQQHFVHTIDNNVILQCILYKFQTYYIYIYKYRYMIMYMYMYMYEDMKKKKQLFLHVVKQLSFIGICLYIIMFSQMFSLYRQRQQYSFVFLMEHCLHQIHGIHDVDHCYLCSYYLCCYHCLLVVLG